MADSKLSNGIWPVALQGSILKTLTCGGLYDLHETFSGTLKNCEKKIKLNISFRLGSER